MFHNPQCTRGVLRVNLLTKNWIKYPGLYKKVMYATLQPHEVVHGWVQFKKKKEFLLGCNRVSRSSGKNHCFQPHPLCGAGRGRGVNFKKKLARN